MAGLMGAPEVVAQKVAAVQNPVTVPEVKIQDSVKPIPAPEFIDTPLGKIPITNTEPAAAVPADTTKIETFDQAFGTPQALAVFGMPITNPAEFIEKGLPVIKKWREDSAIVGKAKSDLETLTLSISNLDPLAKEILNASIEGAKNGDDSWKSMLTPSTALTFKEPVEKLDSNKLVDNYFPGQFTPEQLSDKEDRAAQIAIQASRDKYISDKEKKDQGIQQRVEKAAQQRTAVSASLQSAIDKINTHLPISQDEGRISEVKTLMENGQWVDLFFNKDGTWNEQAAANITLAKYGNSTFSTLIGVITNKVKSEANEEVVDRGALTKVTGSGAGQNVQHKKQDENVNALVGLMSGQKSHF